MEQTSTPRRLGWRFDWRSVWESPRLLLAVVLSLLYAAVLFFGFSWSHCFFSTCPNVAKLAVFQPGGAPVLLDRNGEVFADLASAERKIVPLSSLPSLVPQAFLAVEDQRFYEHGGVDWKRVGGAVLANLRAGGFAQGFSTISMQLARNVFPESLPGEEQTTRRKLLEVRVAQQIEGRYSKEEILELYLNNIYFGNRATGIEAAARQYFGRSAQELTLPQAALLAALPKAPSHYDPRRHPQEALTRRNLVLSLMREQGRTPRFLAEKAKLEPLGLAPAPRQEKVEAGPRPLLRGAGAARARGAVRRQSLHPAAADRHHARLRRPAGRRGGAAPAAQADRVREIWAPSRAPATRRTPSRPTTAPPISRAPP